MRKYIAVVLSIFFTINIAHAMSDNEAMQYSIKALLTSDDVDTIRPLGALLVQVNSYEPLPPYVVELAAELAQLEIQKQKVDVIKLIWFVRIIGTSKNGKYSELLQSIDDRTALKRIDDEIASVRTKLKSTAEPVWRSSGFNLNDYRDSLAQVQQAHANNERLRISALNHLKKVNDTYTLLGYPNHLRIRHSFMPGQVGPKMEATWDNRYRVMFNFLPPKALTQGWLGLFFKDMRVSGVDPIPDLGDATSINKRILSPNYKETRLILGELRDVYSLSDSTLSIINEFSTTNADSQDGFVIGNLKRASYLLGKSADAKYIDTLTRLRRSGDRSLQNEATISLFRVYIATNNLALLYPEIESDDPTTARFAARAINDEGVFDNETLTRLYNRVARSAATMDDTLADGLAIMMKNIGQSGELIYREKLDEISRTAAHEKVRKHAVAASKLLTEEL